MTETVATSRNRCGVVVALAAVLGIAAAACGDDAEPAAVAPPTDATSPVDDPVGPGGAPETNGAGDEPIVVVDERGEEVAIESVDRIVPLDGDVAEVVFALGLGDRVVATDISATYPPEADALPEIGYQRALAPEPILDVEPTVVLGTEVAGPPGTIDALEAVGIPVVIVPRAAGPEGPGRKIEAVADALGVPDVGDELAAEVRAEIAAATVPAELADTGPRTVALYLRGTDVQLVLGEGSGIDWLLEAAGAVDVADDLGIADETEPIGAEALVAAAPEVIIVPELGLESVGGIEGVLEIPGLAGTPAGERGAVLSYDDQLMLGNGPRTGEFLARLVEDLRAMTTTGATE